LSESFDGAQDERRSFDIIEDFPFMLRVSKHSEAFFRNLASAVAAPWVAGALCSAARFELAEPPVAVARLVPAFAALASGRLSRRRRPSLMRPRYQRRRGHVLWRCQ